MSMRTYQKIKSLGKGSFGQAWLVVSKVDRKRYVAKVMQEFTTKEEKIACLHEARVLKSLTHDNIVRYVDSFAEGDKFHIVMEFVDGGDLSQLIRRQKRVRRRLSEERVLHIFWQTCLALNFCHKNKIMHRDIKSQNIFLTQSGSVKVGDFGIARVLDSTCALAQTKIGTPYYLSPEICQDKPYNQKSDIWALGVLLYEMLTLDVPFQSKDMMNLVRKIMFQHPAPIRGGYSSGIQNLVRALLAKDPKRRPTAEQVLTHPLFCKYTENRRSADSSSAAVSRRSKPKMVRLVRAPPPAPERQSQQGRFVVVKKSAESMPKIAAMIPPPPSSSHYPAMERRVPSDKSRSSAKHQPTLELLAKARREAFEERVALKKKMAGIGGRPVPSVKRLQKVVLKVDNCHKSNLTKLRHVRHPPSSASGRNHAELLKLKMLAEARKQAFADRMALRKKMEGMGGRPVSRNPQEKSARAAVKTERSSTNRVGCKGRDERLAKETELLAKLTKARKEAFAGRMALRKKMEGIGGRPINVRKNAAARAAITTGLREINPQSHARGDESKKLDALARARREAFEERVALKKKMAGIGGRPVPNRTEGVSSGAAATVISKKSKSQSRLVPSRSRSEDDEKAKLEMLARARKQAFEERLALRKKMASMSDRGEPASSRISEQKMAPVSADCKATPKREDLRSRAKEQNEAYLSKLAEARKRAFAERMALKKKMAAHMTSAAVSATMKSPPSIAPSVSRDVRCTRKQQFRRQLETKVGARVESKASLESKEKENYACARPAEKDVSSSKHTKLIRRVGADGCMTPVGRGRNTKTNNIESPSEFAFTSPPPLSCGPNRANTSDMQIYLEGHLGKTLLKDLCQAIASGKSAIPMMKRVPGGLSRAQHIIPLVRQYSSLLVTTAGRH